MLALGSPAGTAREAEPAIEFFFVTVVNDILVNDGLLLFPGLANNTLRAPELLCPAEINSLVPLPLAVG